MAKEPAVRWWPRGGRESRRPEGSARLTLPRHGPGTERRAVFHLQPQRCRPTTREEGQDFQPMNAWFRPTASCGSKNGDRVPVIKRLFEKRAGASSCPAGCFYSESAEV